jgi:TrmH family RNA methyltransferase
MHRITSRANSLIKQVASLQTSKGRSQHQQFIATGKRTLSAFLDAGWQPHHIFYTTDSSPFSFDDPAIAIQVTPEVITKIDPTKTPSGLVGLFTIPSFPAHPLGPGIVLCNMTNPGNIGTLIRTAAAMAKKTVVLIDGADPWSPKVVQASAGASAKVNIYRISWQELLTQKTVPLIGLIPRNGQAPSADVLHESLIVVGNEAHGIPPKWLDDCDVRISLPMPGHTESLNAAIAGSIALYIAR